MIKLGQSDKFADVRFSSDELALISNALNEVCNGIDIDDAEFATRLGGQRQEVRQLLDDLGSLIG
ncbi:hypothetical protein [Caulobacter sp. DWR2-3-1b2]|uniref:hypothetical protein n=1 Tax=unclassified Caulobacter TaxID=2648921 RepID=UPI003CE6AFC5